MSRRRNANAPVLGRRVVPLHATPERTRPAGQREPRAISSLPARRSDPRDVAAQGLFVAARSSRRRTNPPRVFSYPCLALDEYCLADLRAPLKDRWHLLKSST